MDRVSDEVAHVHFPDSGISENVSIVDMKQALSQWIEVSLLTFPVALQSMRLSCWRLQVNSNLI